MNPAAKLAGLVLLGLLSLATRGQAQTNVTVQNQTYTSGQNVTVTASSQIGTAGTVNVNSGATVTFQSGGTIVLSPGFKAQAGSTFRAQVPVNNALYISQNVPLAINPGETKQISLTFTNTGGKVWGVGSSHKLGSEFDNSTWGITRVGPGADVPLGQTKTFTFNITAPTTPGSYPFQWRMVQDGVEWFGQSSPRINIKVVSNPPANDNDHDGLPDSYTQDSDGDGIPDAVETLLGLNPNNAGDTVPGRTKTYDYDRRNQLKSGPGRTYNLDAEGNILSP